MHLLARLRRFDEQHVDAGLDITLGAFKRPVETLDGDRIGAADDEKVVAAARIGGGLDLAHHLARRDQGLAVQVAAAFWHGLVFELYGRGPGPLEQPHCANDVERVAEAGIAVDHQRYVVVLLDRTHDLRDLVHADEADVRPADLRERHGCARKVGEREPRLGDKQRGIGVVAARRHDDVRALKLLTQRHVVGQLVLPNLFFRCGTRPPSFTISMRCGGTVSQE